MNVSSTYYSNNDGAYPYYYGDHYNYTAQYLLEYGLNQQTSTITGIGYCLFAGVTLMLYSRLLTVNKYLWIMQNRTDFDTMHMLRILILIHFFAYFSNHILPRFQISTKSTIFIAIDLIAYL
jgi:hypothetical protein